MIENDLYTKVFTCSYQHKVIAVKNNEHIVDQVSFRFITIARHKYRI